MALLAGADVDKLVGGSHGGQRMGARGYLLIERIRVEGTGVNVGPGHKLVLRVEDEVLNEWLGWWPGH